MSDELQPAEAPAAASRRDPIGAVRQFAARFYTPGNAFLAPDFAVRYLIICIVVAGYLWLQWHSPKEGAVPQELVGIAGIVTGWALGGKGSPTMKAIVAIVYVYAEVAFLVAFGWAPGAITGQVALIIGAYFGGGETKRDTAAPAAQKPGGP